MRAQEENRIGGWGPITHSLFNSRSSTCETIANAALRFGERLGEKGRQVWDPSEQTVSRSWVEGYRLRKGVRSMVRYEETFGNCFCTTYAGCIKSLKLGNQSEAAQLQCFCSLCFAQPISSQIIDSRHFLQPG